jgi:dTDP-4-amino-4,6-dideoxygalactose transaminase
VGLNSRLDAIQAAVLDVKLKHLDTWTKRRCEIAKMYDEGLSDVVIVPHISPNVVHAYHQYAIRTKQRDVLLERLKQHNIAAGIYYPLPLHLQEAFPGGRKGDCPIAEKVSEEILSLPIYPEMTDEQVRYVIDVVKGMPKAAQ